jgi:hypothetical protein
MRFAGVLPVAAQPVIDSCVGLPDPALICWRQCPDTNHGVAVENTQDFDSQTAANDFLACTNPISDIYIWGCWLGDTPDPHASFDVEIWPADLTAPVWSDFFGTYSFEDPCSFALVATNSDEEMFMDPVTPLILGHPTNLWLYHFSIPPNNPPPLIPGAPYWLSVSVDATNDFGWQSCVTNDIELDNSMFSESDDPDPGDWVELFYPPSHPYAPESMDLAFALKTRERDWLSNSLAAVTLVWPGVVQPSGVPETVVLIGPTTVYVDIGPNGQTVETSSAGLDQAHSEMVELDLFGTSSMGPMNIQLARPDQPPYLRSTGLLTETQHITNGILGVPPFAPTGEATSDFNIYFQATVNTTNYGPVTFFNLKPKIVNSTITNKPPGTPAPGGKNVYTAATPLQIFAKTGNLRALLLFILHQPVPETNKICILCEPETITKQPKYPATFNVTAAEVSTNGELQPLTYQWQEEKQGSASFESIDGATNASYTTPPLQTGDSGTQFQVIVSDGVNAPVTSKPATVTIGRPNLTCVQEPDGIAIHCSDDVCVVQSAGSLSGPWENVCVGPVCAVPDTASSQFYRGCIESGSCLITGVVKDPSGNPEAGVCVGLPDGGPACVSGFDGSFSCQVPPGMCQMMISELTNVFDTTTQETNLIDVSVIIEVPAATNITTQVNLTTACAAQQTCAGISWCAMAQGTIIQGSRTTNSPVYYAGGAYSPGGPTPAAQVFAISPGSSLPQPIIPGGGVLQMSGPNPAPGSYVLAVITDLCGSESTGFCSLTVP